MKLGYIRVSTIEQNPERQEKLLQEAGAERLFTDKVSGKDVNRPQLTALLGMVREGDTVLVASIDRLARSLSDLLALVRQITDSKATVKFLKENLSFDGTAKAVETLNLSLLGAFAEFERSLIRERQAEGIAIAKAKGKYKGGTDKLSLEQKQQLMTDVALGVPKAKVARKFGIAVNSVYNYLKRP